MYSKVIGNNLKIEVYFDNNLIDQGYLINVDSYKEDGTNYVIMQRRGGRLETYPNEEDYTFFIVDTFTEVNK